MNLARWAFAGLLTSVVGWAGCVYRTSESVDPTVTSEVKSADQPLDSSAPSAGKDKIPVHVANWEETEKRIAGHSGKVVVVDFWSTWCTPCVREFPHLVELQQQFPKEVACMSVNCNYTGAADDSLDEIRQVALKFLTEKQAQFDNVVSSEADTDLLAKIKAVSVPVVQVYDKQGKLRKQFMNEDGEFGDEGFEYSKHIVPLVEQLLAE